MNEKNLQQASAFRPFPGKLIPFATVAMNTRKHEITDVIGGNIGSHSTAKRECMFYVIDILPFPIFLDTRELGKTASRIITTILLAFQLFRNLSRCIRTQNRFLAGDTLQDSSSGGHPPSWGVLVANISLPYYFFMGLIVCSVHPRALFSRTSAFPLYVSFAITFLARRMQAINPLARKEKVLLCSRKKLLAYNTLFIPCWNWSSFSRLVRKGLPSVSFTAFSALISQTVFCLLIVPKELRGSRFSFKALPTLFVPQRCRFIRGWLTFSSRNAFFAYSTQPITISLLPPEEVWRGRFFLFAHTTYSRFWKSQFWTSVSGILVFMMARPTIRIQPIMIWVFTFLVGMEVYKCSRKDFLASWATFMSFWYDGFRDTSTFFYTLLTDIAEFIRPLLFPGKFFESGRKPLQACSALLLRGIIHDLNGLSFLALSSCCQGNKAIPFSRGVITPSLGNTIDYTFFSPGQKTDARIFQGGHRF
jgi:hypothetical protein